MQTWTQAVKAYETALQLRPGDADSKFNRDFVKRKIKDLQQKQNQPQNQPQNQNQPQGPQQGPPQNSPQQGNGGQQPPGQQPPGQQPPPASAGQPKPAAGNEKGEPGEGSGDDDRADAERLPGQMSPEEARELLDSQKGEERHALGLTVARQERDAPPDKPIKDW